MLLYIHGYKGSPGRKITLIEKVFGDMYENIKAPQLRNVSVTADMAQLDVLLSEESAANLKYPNLIVGNSLGGFYAWDISRRGNCVCLMINPSLIPFVSLKKYPGTTYKFLKHLCARFACIYEEGAEPNKIWAAYCRDDECIDHAATTELILKQPKSRRRNYDKTVFFPVSNGGHAFDNEEELEKVFRAVKEDIQTNGYFDVTCGL